MADELLYWEDLREAGRVEIGKHTFTEADIIAFARQFDPQPFHVDPEAAKKSFFGGLIASGWHTCCMAMRLMVDKYVNRSASLGSPGLDSIRWLAPVRAGDTLTYYRDTTAGPASARPAGTASAGSRRCARAAPSPTTGTPPPRARRRASRTSACSIRSGRR